MPYSFAISELAFRSCLLISNFRRYFLRGQHFDRVYYSLQLEFVIFLGNLPKFFVFYSSRLLNFWVSAYS